MNIYTLFKYNGYIYIYIYYMKSNQLIVWSGKVKIRFWSWHIKKEAMLTGSKPLPPMSKIKHPFFLTSSLRHFKCHATSCFSLQLFLIPLYPFEQTSNAVLLFL